MIHFIPRQRIADGPEPEPPKLLSKSTDGPCLYRNLNRELKEHVVKCCSGKYDSRHLDNLTKWLKEVVLPTIDEVCSRNPSIAQLLAGNKRKVFEDNLKLLLLRVFGETLSDELLSICFDYPDCQPILLDLRHCINATNIRPRIVNQLKHDLEKRLLHAGVSTANVLDAYISVVRALKFLDPDGIFVQLVTPPVRDYLKQRDDTIKVILLSLTEESGDLAEELSKNPYDSLKVNLDLIWHTWNPDPIDIPKDKHNLREADLIQTLVSIYGSKTLFVDEYRTLLADRLLKMSKPTSIPREVKCLELLKLRFGDSDLQKCEVMLKDVTDSQRMNTRYNEGQTKVIGTQDLSFSSLIVSAQFWPEFKQEKLDLPPIVSEAIEKYTQTFETVKGNRTLEWQRHIGIVEIEIETKGNATTFTCTPPQAVLLWHFQEKPRWTIDELSQSTGMESNLVRSRIRFWLTRGVLALIKTDTYALQDDEDSESRYEKAGAALVGTKYLEDEEMDSPMTSTSALRETELQMFWSYIEGMLTNLGTLPLTRIHSMLRLFATVECSSEELQKFLDEKVSQGLLVYSAGQYQLEK